ncbi:MAG: hypothetical protein AAFU80_06830 [Pseudomonadota bacterium]
MVSIFFLADALGVNYQKARKLIRQPYPLPVAATSSPTNGGGATRLYALSDVVARLREHKIDSSKIADIIRKARENV